MAASDQIDAAAEAINRVRMDTLFGNAYGIEPDDVAMVGDEGTSHFLLAISALETARLHMKLAALHARKEGR